MSLFEANPTDTPLAERMRPRRLDEVVGQDHLVAPDAAFRAMVESGSLRSAILWGPPGAGKTTLARLAAAAKGHRFVTFSAVLSGIKEVRAVMAEAARDRATLGRLTLLFIDEIHRFNRAQQDAFLPHVESGDVVLLGATTENPSFEVNAALLSRCHVFVLRPLEPDDLRGLLQAALTDRERGVGGAGLELLDGVLDDLVALADGDARRALNALETLALLQPPDADGARRVDRAGMARLLQKQLAHDKGGDSHYDVISALIKSVRNSDPDAAIYWLARLLEAGEAPMFVARRLVILASEDIGLADPAALPLAVAAQQATHLVGMPEARLMLSEATLYLALAPKSNSVLTAYQAASADVHGRPNEPVPVQLRNAPTALMKSLGHGDGYRYAHDDPDAATMACLPPGLAERRYYRPGAAGAEADLGRHRSRRKPSGRD